MTNCNVLFFYLEIGSVTQKPSWTTVRTTTTKRPTTTLLMSSSKPTTQKPIVVEGSNGKPPKHCVHGEYYPDSCTSFHICVNGNLISRQCGPGLNWNREKGMCDWAFKNPCIEKPKKTASLIATSAKLTVSKSIVKLCLYKYQSIVRYILKYQSIIKI